MLQNLNYKILEINMNIQGTITALVTPFLNDEIDYKSLEILIKRQVNSNISAISPAGTTGEAPTLSNIELEKLLKFTVEKTNNKKPVIAGVGTNSTKTTLEKVKIAEKANVDALLIVAPYYNKPSQNGFYEHFKVISESTDLPICLYNIPSRCAASMNIDTICKIAELENVIAIKETESSEKILSLRNNIAKDFLIFSGDDVNALSYNINGANGCFSVASNIFPDEFAEIHKMFFTNNLEKAYKLQSYYLDLVLNLFIEPNPVPCKYLLNKMGLIEADVRLPLTAPTSESKKSLDKLYNQYFNE